MANNIVHTVPIRSVILHSFLDAAKPKKGIISPGIVLHAFQWDEWETLPVSAPRNGKIRSPPVPRGCGVVLRRL